MTSRHYRVPDPSLPGDPAGICESDRHRWPCHAHILGEALRKVLELPGEWDEIDDGPMSALTEDRGWVRAACARDLRDAITRALLGEGSTDGK